jgi:hypothetical protein
MKFMLTFDWNPNKETRAEAVERFRNTGALPPEGVKLLGRWTRADFSGGFDLLETDDAKKLFEFAIYVGDPDEVGDYPSPGRPGIESGSGKRHQLDFAVQTLGLTAAAGFAVTPPGKCSVLDLSFHLQSPANSLRRALSSQTPANPNQSGIHYDADQLNL